MAPHTMSRRSLVGRSAAGLGIALAGDFAGLFGPDHALARRSQLGYGPLVTDPAGRLSLPSGFRYEVVARAGETTLDTGQPSPGASDGTASFRRYGGGTTLVTNHEMTDAEDFPVPHVEGLVYDPDAHGGTTTIELDHHGKRRREYVSLAGTADNCAGGVTPWGTWLTCEEESVILSKPHGYVFEVDPQDRRANADPHPIKAFGRFDHESVAVDPRENVFYLTEDAEEPYGLLYRWHGPRRLGRGALRRLPDTVGVLEALVAFSRGGEFVPDLSAATQPGTTLRATWVAIPERDATTTPTRQQLERVTRSQKLEGMWWGNGGAYFTASYARAAEGSATDHDGQVWFYDPRRGTLTLKLHLAYTPADNDTDPDGPDNITVSAYGGVIMAEDGEGVQHLVGVTDRGQTFFLARNEESDSEFTGPNFSPDGRTLFANVQDSGTVYAIRGPWRRF